MDAVNATLETLPILLGLMNFPERARRAKAQRK